MIRVVITWDASIGQKNTRQSSSGRIVLIWPRQHVSRVGMRVINGLGAELYRAGYDEDSTDRKGKCRNDAWDRATARRTRHTIWAQGSEGARACGGRVGEIVLLAVPYAAISDVITQIGSAADGKVVVDVTNALGSGMELAIGFSTSAAEELQKSLPKAKVIKAFNTVFAQNQSTARVGAEQLSAFIAGDDDAAKQVVMRLAAAIGFDPIDVGALRSALYRADGDVAYLTGVRLENGHEYWTQASERLNSIDESLL